MSEYNTFYDDRTRTRISQCITAEGKYAVLFTRNREQEVKLFNTPSAQFDCFSRNVKWYRGY